MVHTIIVVNIRAPVESLLIYVIIRKLNLQWSVKVFDCLYSGTQCRPSSDCSSRSSLVWVCPVCQGTLQYIVICHFHWKGLNFVTILFVFVLINGRENNDFQFFVVQIVCRVWLQSWVIKVAFEVIIWWPNKEFFLPIYWKRAFDHFYCHILA